MVVIALVNLRQFTVIAVKLFKELLEDLHTLLLKL
jgi:hypothetical protein